MKKFIALFLTLVMIVTVFSVPALAASNPTDISGHQYETEIKRLDGYNALGGLMSGAKFSPDQKISEADFCKIISRLFPGRNVGTTSTSASTATMVWACRELETVSKTLGYQTTWQQVGTEDLTRARACFLICLWLDSSSGISSMVGVDVSVTTTPGSNYPGYDYGYWYCPFKDVYGTYYYDAVVWMTNNGITNGTSATTFSPEQTCSQAEILTFIWRAYDSPNSTATCPISGVSKDAYYYKALCWAGEKGMFSGTGDNNDPTKTICTRAMAVYYLWKAAGSPSVYYSSYSKFTDVSSNASYRSAVGWASEKNITNGTSSTTFSPLDSVTRGQIAVFLYRAKH